MKREKVVVTGATGFGDNDKTLGYIPYIEIKASRDFDVEMYMIQCTLHIVLKIYTINNARWSLFIHEIADTHITNNKKVFPNIHCNSPKIIQNLNFFLWNPVQFLSLVCLYNDSKSVLMYFFKNYRYLHFAKNYNNETNLLVCLFRYIWNLLHLKLIFFSCALVLW